MSTILKTLKKLEEEKSILDQNRDIKDMMLDSDFQLSPADSNRRNRNLRILGFFSLAALGVGLFYIHLIMNPGSGNPIPTAVSQQPIAPLISKSTGAVSTPSDASVSGISLSVISEKKPEVPFNQVPGFQNNLLSSPEPSMTENRVLQSVSEKDPAQAVSTIATTLTVKNSKVKNVLPLIQETPQEVLKPLESIRALLQNEERGALGKYPVQEKKISRNSIFIPGMKIKGIIFLTQDHSANYIFVSTPNSNNLKMKVGDSINGATLKTIYPDKVSFLYQEKTGNMGIGD